MRAVPLFVVALVASCNKGPSCSEQKRIAGDKIRIARLAASDTKAEQQAFNAAARRLEELREFQVKLIQGISQVRTAAACSPKMICCDKVAAWIAAEAKAPEGERPTWRLPAFGDANKLAPPELAKHMVTYDNAAGRLASLLQKGGDAPLAEVTAACNEANTEIDLVRSMSPNVVSTAVSAAEANHKATGETLESAKGRAAIFQQWEDALVKDTKFEVPPPSPTEPAKVSEARAAAKSVQGCLK